MKNSMRHTTRLLLLSLLVLGLAGCHQSVIPADGDRMDGCGRMVRITAKILPSNAPLRAAGDVKDDPDVPSTPFDPEVLDPNKTHFDEDRIDHVTLYVYDKGKLIKTIFYHDPTLTAGMPTPFDGLEVKSFGNEAGGTFTFDLILSPGRYRFVLLVNDPQCYNEGKNGRIRDPKKIYLDQMTTARGFLSSQLLMTSIQTRADKYRNSEQPRVIPMTGQAMLTIPKGMDDDTPTIVTPSIDLERIMARIEIILTTANEAKTEYLKPELANYAVDNRGYVDGTTGGRLTKGKLVDLVDRDWRAGTLEILPARGEYTATGKGMNDDSRLYSDRTASDYLQYFSDAATYRAKVTTPYAEDMDVQNVFGDFPKMYRQSSKSKVGANELGHYWLYIPPMFIDGLKKEDMPYILIGINPKKTEPIPADATAAAKQMTYFHLPITTLLSAAEGGEKFEIRRNTVYSIYASFRGDRIILNDGIKVLPWKTVDQTIDINVDDDSGDDQDGVIDGHGGGTLPNDPN